MDRDDRKRKIRAFQDAEARERAVSTPRDPRSDVVYPGIGSRVASLLVLPSFEATEVWDVRASRAGTADLAVYVSRSATPREPPPATVVGYDRLDSSRVDIAALIARLSSISLPLAVRSAPAAALGELDGTGYELAIDGHLCGARFAWHHHGPTAWRPMIDIAEELLATFRSLAPVQ
jgi:hypothetical protein